MRSPLVIPAVLVAGFLVMSASRSQAAANASAAGSGFRNLQVLPSDISQEQLEATMNGFADALGVKCSFCHVVDEYHLDDKEHKRIARQMVLLVRNLKATGEEYFPAGKAAEMSCWTCHRGSAEIEPPTADEEWHS